MTKRYSVLTVFIFLLTNIFSQSVNAFENIIIEINDNSTSLYDCVGKRIIIDEFDQGFVPPSMFTGSCGYSEQGIPFYSQEVDADAWILPIEDCFPADFPEKIGGYTYNRNGHSSFLAFKNWDTDSQKVWINVTIGAWKYAFPNPYEKEYQIRYFQDVDLGIDSMIILTVPGSGYCTSIEKINNYNVQISAKGWIKGKVEAISINQSSGTSEMTPIDAKVRLFEEGNLIYLEEQFCNGGLFSFDTVDTNKNYYLSVYYDTLDALGNPITTHVEVEDLMTDTNVEVMHNVALVVQMSEVLDSIKDCQMPVGLFDGGVNYDVDYEFETTSSEYILDGFNYMAEDHREEIECLARQMMVHMAVSDYLYSSHKLSEEGLNSVSELIKMALNLILGTVKFKDDPPDGDVGDAANSLISAYISSISRLIKDAADAITSKIDSEDATEINNTIKTILAEVEMLGDSKGGLGFSNSANLAYWIVDVLGEVVIYGGTKLLNDKVHVEMDCQNVINTANDHAQNCNPNGDLNTSLQGTISKSPGHSSYVYDDDILSMQKVSDAYNYRWNGRYVLIASEWTDVASKIALVLAAPTGGTAAAVASFLKTFEKVLQAGAASLFGMGAYTAFDRWSELDNELEACNDFAFNQKSAPLILKPYEIKQLNNQFLAVNNAFSNYEGIAQEIVNYALLDDTNNVVIRVDSLITLENKITEQLEAQLIAVYNGVYFNRDSMGSFDEFYKNYLLEKDSSQFARLIFSSNLFAYLTDTPGSIHSYKDSLSEAFYSMSQIDSSFLSKSSDMSDSLSTKNAGAYIVPEGLVIPDSACGNSWIEMEAVIKNYGTINAEGVYIKLAQVEHFNYSVDSIYIGTINPGDSASFVFNLGVPNVDTFGYVGLKFFSTNAGQITKGKSVVVNYTNDSILVSENLSDISCYGQSDGSIDLNVSGGSGVFNYAWSQGNQSNQINNLSAGTYIVTISDTNSCSYTKHFKIAEPDSFYINSTSEPATINGIDGIALVDAFGGTPPYTYLWNDNSSQNTDTAFNLSPGVYECTITDASGCMIVESVQVDPFTNIKDLLKNNVHLYPNPSNGLFNISLNLPRLSNVEIQIFSSIGKIVHTQTLNDIKTGNKQINLKNLSAGFYLIEYKIEDESIFEKISIIND